MKARLFFIVAAAALAALVASPRAARAASVAKGPWVQHVTTSSAVIRVEVNPPGPVSIEVQGPGQLGLDGGTIRTIASGEKTALHSVTVDGLAASTRYTYTVRGQGEAKFAAFTTAPDHATPFHFLVYGDNRSDDAAHAAVVRAMTNVKSDFLINTGDFVERGDSSGEWQTFFDIEAPLLQERCLVACVGNHEITDGAGTSFIRYFGPNETLGALEQLQGTFRWSNARFFLVNGMVSYRSGPDRSWLDKALGDADNEKDLDWRIVVVHHGPWSSGPHGDSRELTVAGIPALFARHKVDLVIAGHDHIYERGIVDGAAYIVSGGGGAPPYRVKGKRASARKVESSHHFIDASVSGSTIAFTATRADGTTIERCGLHKNAGWDCDGDSAPTLPPAASASEPRNGRGATSSTSSSSPPASTTASRCSCRAVGGARDARDAAPPFTLAALVVAFLARRRARAAVSRDLHR